MLTMLKSKLRRFGRDEDANLTVEAILLLPVMLWGFGAMFVFFDNFKAHSTAQKAAYTVADMISRETDYINPAYINGSRDLVAFLSETPLNDTSIRITVIKYNADKDKYQRIWSEARGAALSPASNTEVKNMSNRLPAMVHNEQVILVETHTTYEEVPLIGLLNNNVETFVFTRPRFAPQVLWQS